MTDLVIKPSNSGGSVKLQTEGGTNGLTMASTGDLTTSGNVAVTGTMTGGTLGTGVTFPADHIIQVKSTTKTDTTSRVNNNTSVDFADITGMSVSITPKTGSKVFVQAMLGIGANANYTANIRLVRGSTAICVADEAGNRAPSTQQGFRNTSTAIINSICISFLDTSPGGDGSTAITYKLQWDGENGSTSYLNMSQNNLDRYDQARTASTITVMEIAG